MKKCFVVIIMFMMTTLSLWSQEINVDDRVTITQSNKPFIGVYTFGYQGLPSSGYPQFQLNNYGGTPTNIQATNDNSILGMFAFSGHNGSAKKTVGILRVKSMNDFSSNLSARMDFLIGPNREQRMTIIGDSGFIGMGTQLPQTQLHIQGNTPNVAGTTSDLVDVLVEDDQFAYYEAKSDTWAGYTFHTNNSSLNSGMFYNHFDNHLIFTSGGLQPRMLIDNQGRIGVGLNGDLPTQNMDVGGLIRMRLGAQAGYIPVSDAEGVMNWVDPSTIMGSQSPWSSNVANIYYDQGDVSIGTNNATAKLEVRDTDNPTHDVTIKATSNVNSTTATVIEANYENNSIYDGTAISAWSNTVSGYGYAVRGIAGYMGILGEAQGGGYTGSAFGVYGYASGDAGTRYSIYGDDVTGMPSAGYAGYFNGDVSVLGTFNNPSDARLKKNVKTYEDALGIISQLNAKTYEFRNTEYGHMGLPDGRQIGFIAQELEEVLPSLVKENIHPEITERDGEGNRVVVREAVSYKGVDYMALIPVLAQGIKELDNENQELQSTNEKLMDELAEMKAQFNQLANQVNEKFNQMEEDMSQCCMTEIDSRMTNTDIDLNGGDMATLEQNIPNPFHQQTIIKYYIPSSAQNAILTITDMRGAPLKSVDLVETGLGTVTINANELPVGTYIYSLFVDGRQIASKQMILVK